MSLYHMPTGRYVDALEGFTLQACHDLAVNVDLYTPQKATSVQAAMVWSQAISELGG